MINTTQHIQWQRIRPATSLAFSCLSGARAVSDFPISKPLRVEQLAAMVVAPHGFFILGDLLHDHHKYTTKIDKMNHRSLLVMVVFLNAVSRTQLSVSQHDLDWQPKVKLITDLDRVHANYPRCVQACYLLTDRMQINLEHPHRLLEIDCSAKGSLQNPRSSAPVDWMIRVNTGMPNPWPI